MKSIDDNITGDDIEHIALIGKERKVIKVVCSSNRIKSRLIKSAKNKKLPNLYLSEYLTPYRSKLFYQLRKLKKSFPDKIKTVYTRFGKLFYKLSNNDSYVSVRCSQDIESLNTLMQSAENHN